MRSVVSQEKQRTEEICMIHSKKLEETVLWQVYQEKIASDYTRNKWVKDIYEAAVKYMQDVRRTFQNYTLHDETHILNVIDAMGGLLGNQIQQLTVGEAELLILAACLHDLGMVYDEEEKEKYYKDEEACRKFLREYYPELLGYSAEDWTEDNRKWYLRTIHPFRLFEVLQNEAWKELFNQCPLETVPKRCIIAVCQAHGENSVELYNNSELRHLVANDVDPLFCALLLRLGDLLDFDDTRAPRILYNYVTCNEESRMEWDKHRASAGFCYSEYPSVGGLPYKACCMNPGVEHAIRDYLDWIDEELSNCIKLQKYCGKEWQQKFPFPRMVLRDEIESDGYMSGDFCMSIDHTQVLKFLTGENLYDNSDVFVRELLQNAIDATLLRGEMDTDFIPEKSRINIWEWNDAEGNIWFRIDDQGTGMTLGMLQRYFLKVGNSYYNSRELERDLRDHGQIEKYQGISRFGIGFLSSFLCGDYAEVSTLYFDSDKNRREEGAVEAYQTVHYGLRLQVTGLSGYYTLKNQSKHHHIDIPLPVPARDYDINEQEELERDGYRVKPGTSIVIRLDPGMLGAVDLRRAIEKYLCGARVPVYYNNMRVGKTYTEIMNTVHEVEGENIVEFNTEMKKGFDHFFPEICGQYPKIVETVISLDSEENRIISDLSGVLVKYKLHFEKVPRWKIKDQIYELVWHVDCTKGEIPEITFFCLNKRTATQGYSRKWEEMEKRYGPEKITLLGEEFDKWSVCPETTELIEKVWQPFVEEDLYEVWTAYYDYLQEVVVSFPMVDCGCLHLESLSSNNQYGGVTCVYQGVVAGDIDSSKYNVQGSLGLFLLGSIWKPMVEISRSTISALPLRVLLAITGILTKYQMLKEKGKDLARLGEWRNSSLNEWRVARTFQLDKWMLENLEEFFQKNRQILHKSSKNIDEFDKFLTESDDYAVMHKYLMAYFQDTYQMTINYEEGQIITFYDKEKDINGDIFDIFPPMMFCEAASDRSRRYICSASNTGRKGITLDHPFVIWLLDNAIQLKQYYRRQFQQIIDCLCQAEAEVVIQICNNIREQLIVLTEHHGVNVSTFPRLSMDDFWTINEENG